MDEIQLPAHLGGGTLEVTHLTKESRRDGGTGWSRGLSAAQIGDLVDLAGALAIHFPPIKQRRVTERPFFSKLEKLGMLEDLNQRLLRVTG
jgi:hypothetical protein